MHIIHRYELKQELLRKIQDRHEVQKQTEKSKEKKRQISHEFGIVFIISKI